MSVESVTYINDLEPDRPRASDRISQGDIIATCGY